jgi:hypothetical protein
MLQSLFALLLVTASASLAKDERARFVNEYVRGLSQVADLRADAARTGSTEEMGRIADCVRNGTRLQSELEDISRTTRLIKLPGEHSQSPETLARIWEEEGTVYQKLTEMCVMFTPGSTPQVDYGAIEAEAPKLAAKIVELDRMLFESAPLVCDTLLSDASDAQGHSDQLILTRKERDRIVATLNSSFPAIDEQNPGYLTSGAKVLKIFLARSGHRMADER